MKSKVQRCVAKQCHRAQFVCFFSMSISHFYCSFLFKVLFYSFFSSIWSFLMCFSTTKVPCLQQFYQCLNWQKYICQSPPLPVFMTQHEPTGTNRKVSTGLAGLLSGSCSRKPICEVVQHRFPYLTPPKHSTIGARGSRMQAMCWGLACTVYIISETRGNLNYFNHSKGKEAAAALTYNSEFKGKVALES